MTLEEAITHAMEVAEENEKYCKVEPNHSASAYHCAERYRQLAEWLRELKAYRESWEYLFATIYEIKSNAETEDIKNRTTFLVNYMRAFEKRIEEVKADDSRMDT